MTDKNKPAVKDAKKAEESMQKWHAENDSSGSSGLPAGVPDPRAELEAECGEIPYAELQKFFAKSMLVNVGPDLDLVDVALAMAQDDADTLKQWADSGQVQRAHDEHARRWLNNQALLKAVTVTPWILVQEVARRNH
jgi:hypothetical protein